MVHLKIRFGPTLYTARSPGNNLLSQAVPFASIIEARI